MQRSYRTLTALEPLVPILTVNERIRIASWFPNTQAGGWRGTRLDQVSSLHLPSQNSLQVTNSNEDICIAGQRYQCCQT